MKKLISILLAVTLLFTWVGVQSFTANAAGTTKVTIHYKPSPTSTDDWNMWLWEFGKDGAAYEFNGTDNFGKVLTVSFNNAITKLGFIVRTNEWKKDVDSDRFITNFTDGQAEIWLVSGDAEIYYSKPSVEPKVTAADFVNTKTIQVALNQPIKKDGSEAKKFTVTTSKGNAKISKVYTIFADSKKMASKWYVMLAGDVDFNETYSVKVKGYRAMDASFRGLYGTQAFNDKYAYSGDDLGNTYTSKATKFRVWAPTASNVDLLTYPSATSAKQTVIKMTKSTKGTWTTTLNGNKNGLIYTYNVHFGNTANEAVDPYVHAVTVNGDRGVVVDLNSTDPAKFNPMSKPKFKKATDAVVYELHIRDFSIAANSGMKNKGKYLAFTETNTKGPNGTKTGVSYIKDLGVTHVQLQPFFDYNSVDESNLDTPQFNWGYDPKNYNAPEGSYSTDPTNPTKRITELKKAIQSLHNNGLRVIMDVVYNHMFSADASNLGLIVPGYYYRYSDATTLANGTGCGNETASDHYMMRKLIVDSVKFWVKEYGVDGFRFDLMGIHDTTTMNKVRSELNKIDPSILVLGEGWNMGNVLPEDQRAAQINAADMPNIAHFNDYIRDGLKGSVFGQSEAGWVNGNYSRRSDAVGGVVGGITKFTTQPVQSVNYVEAHDNNTLWDKLQFTNPQDSTATRLKMDKIAATFIFTAQGIPFMQAGQEFLRTKGGDSNSYKSPDSVNQLDWKRKAANINTVNYYKGLIQLRKAHSAFRMTTGGQIRSNLKFISTGETVIAYTINNKANGDSWKTIVVAHNADRGSKTVKLPSSGTWKIVVNGTAAGTKVIKSFKGSSIKVPALTSMVLYKN